MIKVVWNVIKKIFSVICLVLSPLKRLWCRRKRRTSDTILPLTNHYPSVENLNSNYTALNGARQGGEEMAAWDQWDDQQQQQYNERVQSVEEYRQRQQLLQQNSQEDVPEPDYFQDMIPSYKKQKKILIKKRDEGGVTAGSISNKLAMSTDAPLMQSELASWEEQDNAWDEDDDSELAWEADNVIREKRKQDRQQRQLQHQKRNKEREQQKTTKTHSNLAAVKLS